MKIELRDGKFVVLLDGVKIAEHSRKENAKQEAIKTLSHFMGVVAQL